MLNYISENIEEFATNMFLSAVEQRVSDIELSQSGAIEQRTEEEVSDKKIYLCLRFCIPSSLVLNLETIKAV